MKYLKYLLYLVIVLTIIFIGKGLLNPSVYYESEITINKSVQESWAVMSDESTPPKWINGLKKIEPVKGQPNTVGAISNIYVEENGEEMVMVETLTAVIPNELLAMTFTMDFMNMDYEMLLTENDGQTKIKTKSKTTGNGIFSKSLISFMINSMLKQEDENLKKLKSIIENNTKNYFNETTLDSLK